jgi:hypothetical protein
VYRPHFLKVFDGLDVHRLLMKFIISDPTRTDRLLQIIKLITPASVGSIFLCKESTHLIAVAKIKLLE